MIDQQYIELLRCPHCAPQGKGVLQEDVVNWLTCGDCSAQYPIVDDIPVMLPEEGEKWRGAAAADLPEITSHQRHQAPGCRGLGSLFHRNGTDMPA